MIASHDAQCRKNHGGQNLEDIAKRNGLSPSETLAVLDDEGWFSESKWGNFTTDFKDRKEHPKAKAALAELERRRAIFEGEVLRMVTQEERSRRKCPYPRDDGMENKWEPRKPE